MLSPRNPYPRKNPESHNTILPSTHKKLSLPQKRHPRNRSHPHIPYPQNATPPKTPLQSILYAKTINHTHHSPPRAPSPVFAPIPRIVPPSRSPQTRQSPQFRYDIHTKKSSSRGRGRRGEGGRVGVSLGKVTMGDGQCLVLLGEMRVLFPADNIYFFCFWGLRATWGRLYNGGVFVL
jgi:hypothetical protein